MRKLQVASLFAVLMLALSVVPVFALVGDVNGDGKVRVDDLLLVVNAFGTQKGDPRWDARCDLSGDGKVRIDDLLIVALNFGMPR
jgi:hypothetical protein